jgi:REP element-mobilizing transposase RayT
MAQSLANVLVHFVFSTKNRQPWIKTKDPRFHSFQWQGGYGAFSVSPSQKEIVRRYIANQREHHRRFSFEDENRRLLERNGVPYDERCLWS